MFLFLLLACSDKTPTTPPEKTEQNPVAESQKSIQTSVGSSTSNDANNPTVPEVKEQNESESQVSTSSPTIKPKQVDVIPSPNIDGMSKKEKPDKIYAEDFDKYFNKDEPIRKPEIEEEIVEVSVEANYNVHYNDTNSNILIQVYKDSSTIASSMSHDHVIRARGWEGQVIWKPNEPHNCIFEFQVPVHFLEVDPDFYRKKLNLPGVLSKKDKKEIHKNMMSKNQLWVDKYSHIKFSAQKCVLTDKDVMLVGEMTIRGVTKRIKHPYKFLQDEKLSVSGAFHLNQRALELHPTLHFWVH